MNQLNSGFSLTEKDIDIFGNSSMNNKNEDNSNTKIFNAERYETKLSLRKKKINQTLLNRRKIEEENLENKLFQFDKFIPLNISFTELISKIAEEYKDEKKIIILLNKISCIIEKKYRLEESGTTLKNNICNFTPNDLIENNWAENLYILTQMYYNSEKVILYISRILLFSCLLTNEYSESSIDEKIILDEKDDLNEIGYFISSDKYIDVYNKILEIYLKEDSQISYNMIIFIGTIAKNNETNQNALYMGGTLKCIIDSIDIQRDSKKILNEKIWCLSNFILFNKYNENLDLTLSIQKIYIDIFLNQNKIELLDGINEEINEENFLYNYLKIIENTSYCTQNIYIENLLKSNILEFLMDNISINIEPFLIRIIIAIFINITNADSSIGKRLVNIGIIKYLLNIIHDKTIDITLRYDSLVPINNLIADSQMWNIILFDQKVIKTFCDMLNDENIDQNIFKEVVTGIKDGITFCSNDALNKLIDEYYIIQSVCKAVKHILLQNKPNQIIHEAIIDFSIFILSCLSNNDINLINKIIKNFQNIGGEEILENILNIYSNFKIDNYSQDEQKSIKYILDVAEVIKENIKKNYK